MKKTLIIVLFAIMSVSAFSQNKKEVSKSAIVTPSDSSLTLKKEKAVELYKLLEYCKEAVSTTVSKKITVADATSIITEIMEIQKTIAEKYQPKQTDNVSTAKSKE